MHRLFLGCNLWGAIFLTAAGIAGWFESPHHLRIAIFASVFACLIQSGVVALFLGAAKLTKEHVGRFNMPLSMIDRLNEMYHTLVPLASIGVVVVAVTAIAGGLADVGRVPAWLHLLLAIGAYIYLIVIIPIEFKLHSKMHNLITDVERLVPEPEDAPQVEPHPDYKPDQVVLDRTGRARAFLYMGLTLPLPYLGYTFIAGRDVSFLLIPTVLLTLALLLGAAHQYRAKHKDS